MVSPYDPVGPAQLPGPFNAPGLGGHIPGQPIYVPQPTVPTTTPTVAPTVAPATVPSPAPTTPGGSSAIGQFFSGLGKTIMPAAGIINAVTGSKSPSTPSTDQSKMLAQLTAAGYDTDTANKLITQYNQTAAKSAALKNLPAGFADIIKQHDADVASTTGPTQQRIMDPLAMQLFFQNTIAPYLDKTSQGIRATAAGMGDTMKQLMPNLPPAYQAVLSQSLPGTQAGMAAMGDAYSGAAVAAPAVQQLQNQLSMAWQAQKLAQYYAEKNIAYSGGAGSAIPTPEEIQSILGSINPPAGQ